MDFGLTYDLDLEMTNGEYAEQENGEATVINAFFTDSRVTDKRGYWIDLLSSKVWTYEQSRLTDEVATELTETAREIADDLVSNGIYERIEVNAYVGNGVMTLEVKCYDKNNLIVDRKFAI